MRTPITKSALLKLAAAAVAATGLAAASAGSASANPVATDTVNSSVTLSAGSLNFYPASNTLDPTSGTGAISFGTQPLTGLYDTITDSASTDSTIDVNDATGSGSGWNLTAALTGPFTDSGTDLGGSSSAATFSFVPVSPAAVCDALSSGCTIASDSGGPTTPVALTGTSASTIFEAASTTGLGLNDISGLQWSLGIPANAATGSYTTTVDIALNTGP